MKRVLQALLIVVVIWALSLLTVYILKGWGPVEALINQSHGGTVWQASGFLAAVLILILVLTYAVTKILSKLPVGAAVRGAVTTIHTAISDLFVGQ